jgi:hypothetical protein
MIVIVSLQQLFLFRLIFKGLFWAVFPFGLILTNDKKFLFFLELDFKVFIQLSILEELFAIGLDSKEPFLVILWELRMEVANDLDFNVRKGVFVARVIIISGIDIEKALFVGTVFELN